MHLFLSGGIMQNKKYPYRFTIQFDNTDPGQYLAAQILSVLPSRRKAKFISMLIQDYVNQHGIEGIVLPELPDNRTGLAAWVQDN